MAFSITQSKGQATSATTNSLTFTSTATIGSLLITKWRGNNPGTVTPPSGWTQMFTDTAAAATPTLYGWYKISDGTETAVTVSTTSSITTDIFFEEWAGWVGIPTLDQTATTNSGATAVTTLTIGPTASTVSATELAIAYISMQAAISTPAWTTGDFTIQTSTSRHIMGNQTLSSTGTVSGTATWTTATKVAGGIATFRDVVASTKTSSIILMMGVG